MSYISEIRPQDIEHTQENASWYGEGASALRIHAYVSNDPLGRITQRGENWININGTYGGSVIENWDYSGNNVDTWIVTHQFQVSGAQLQYLYGYDQGHAMTSQQATMSSQTLTHPASGGAISYGTPTSLNQLTTTAGGASFTYDANGNLTSDGTRSYTYDNEGDGRIVSVAVGGSTVATYKYDPLGRRYSKTVGGTTTVYLRGDGGREVGEYDGSGNLLRRLFYAWGSSAPFGAINANGSYSYLHPDALGSVVATSDQNGNVTWKGTYMPYGETPTNVPTSGFGYAGYRYDPETGLYYTNARYYDPRLGRFLEPDPIGQDGGINIYAYTGNDPLNATDPSGLWQVTISGGLGFGGALSFGSNSGQWNIAAYIGPAVGANFSVNPANAAAVRPGTYTGFVGSAGTELGPIGVDVGGNLQTSVPGGSVRNFGTASIDASANFGLYSVGGEATIAANGSVTATPEVTVGGGASAYAGWGASYQSTPSQPDPLAGWVRPPSSNAGPANPPSGPGK